jgi:hypothetical protein
MADARQWPQARLQLRVTSQATIRRVWGKIRETPVLDALSFPRNRESIDDSNL